MCTDFSVEMERKVNESQNKEKDRISRDSGRKPSSEFVRIPIRVLKKKEYEDTKCKKDTDNIESIIKKYIKKPEVCDNTIEKDYSPNNRRTIPIKIQLEVNQRWLVN